MGVPNQLHPGTVQVSSSADVAHQAVVRAAIFAALVGQFHHHFPDEDLPEVLASADGAAFEDAQMMIDLGGPAASGYDLAAVTSTAFASGKAHSDDECVFCAVDEPDVLAEAAVQRGRELAQAVLA